MRGSYNKKGADRSRRPSGAHLWGRPRAGPFALVWRMTDNHGLNVEVQGEEIVITLPGTSFKVAYHKPADKPGLMTTSRSGRWEKGTPMTQAEFYARAWKAAHDKARELGWIV
jgi:hypothetical protein